MTTIAAPTGHPLRRRLRPAAGRSDLRLFATSFAAFFAAISILIA